MSTTQNKFKYVIYARKSSEQKDRQALSIEAQRRELLDFALKEELKVIEILEESQSAYKVGRPVFDKMMKLIEEGAVNAILTWKPDRLARNAMDGGRVIQAMDDNLLQEIRTPYEIFQQSDNRMMVYIHFGMSNDYSRQISANVKRGNREKYRRGEFVGKAPLGYLNSKIGISSNIIPDPEKAPYVKRLFEEYSSGRYSVQDMVRKADSWGLQSVFGHRIAKSGMYTLLRRPVYYGLFQHAEQFHQGTYEPLITKELFDRVQDVLYDRTKPRKQDWVHAYKGLIKCSECGCSITATTKTKHYRKTKRDASYTYYHCTKKRGVCTQKPIQENELNGILTDYVSQIAIDKEVWELGIELLKAKHAQEFDNAIQAKKNFEKEKEKVDRDLERMLKLRLDEEITSEEYALQKKILIDKKLELNEKTADREQSTENWLELAEKFFETCVQARDIMIGEDIERKRNLVQAVGSNLLLKDKNIEFSFRKPFDVLLVPSMRSDWQGWRESNPRWWFWRPLSYR
jgi:site-specific DNA recombinase